MFQKVNLTELRNMRIRGLLLFFFFFFAFTKSILFSHFGLNFFDYGETLHNAVRIIDGAVLYKDIWAFFPPADNYFPAIILTIFGKHLLVVRYIESLLFALFVVTLTLITKEFLKVRYIFMMIVGLVFADLNVYLFFIFLFFYAGILCVIYYLLKKRKPIILVFSGILMGLGTLFRHDTGIIGIMTALFILLVLRKLSFRQGLLFVLSFLIVVGPVVFWLASLGIFGDFLYLSFIRAIEISRMLSPGFNLVNMFSGSFTNAKIYHLFTLFFYMFYLLVYPFVGIYLYSERKKRKVLSASYFSILMLFIFGILQIPYAFSVIEMGHLVKAGIPALALGTFLIQEGISKRFWGKYSFLLSAPLIIFILGNIAISFWWIRYNDTKVDFKQEFVYVNSQHLEGSTHPTAQTLIRTVDFVRKNTKDEEYIFAAPYHAMIYFLTERKIPSKFNNFAAGFVPYDKQKDIISDIEKKNVQIVIYDPVNAPFGKLFLDYSPQIHAYIMDNFETVEKTDMGWLLMRRVND